MDIRAAKPPKGAVPPKPKTMSQTKSETNSDVTVTESEEYEGYQEIAKDMAFLAKYNIYKTDVFEALDAILTGVSIEWDLKKKKKIPCVFRMREAWVADLIITKVDKLAHETPSMSVAAYNNIIAEYNLAASLVSFKNQKFEVKDEQTFTEALEQIQKLPQIVVTALVEKLVVFDRIISVATSDWAIKNFTQPQQEG